MSHEFGRDLTVGSIPRHLLAVSVPMLLGNFLNAAYNIVDTIWVGNIIGKNAVGATAVSFPIIFILIALSSGATMATSILIAQYYGAKDYGMVSRVVNNSFAISCILGIVLTVTGILSGDFLLRLMNTPQEIFEMASSYLKIYLTGFVFMYLSFLVTSILRGIGDTMTPLIFLAIAAVLNTVLDPLLIIGVGPFPRLGLSGAAIATVISMGVACISGLIYLNLKNHIVAPDPRKFILDKNITFLIFKIGLPSIVQQSLVSMGAAFITTFVNAFGAPAIAAFGAAGRIESLAFMPAMSLGMASSTLAGQNLGAGKPERIKEIFKWGILMTSAITITISLMTVSAPRLILSMFVREPDVLEIGVTYLKVVGGAYIFFAVMFISNGIINGAGHTITTMLFTLLSLWGVRVPLASVLSRTSLGSTGIWIAIVASFATTMTISLLYYFSGRWKKAVVKVEFEPVIGE